MKLIFILINYIIMLLININYETKFDHNKLNNSEINTVEIESEIKPLESNKESQTIIESSKAYTDEDLYVLSHVIFGEAGGYSWEHQIGVGSVVLNRVKNDRYPNTIKEVVFQNGQYACTWDGNYNREPDQQAIDVATYLLENGSQYPEYVIFQAQFKQGDNVYKQIGNTYFCYYLKDVK